MLCPSCLAAVPFVDTTSTCASCGARTALDGRFRLDEVWPGERSHDAVDGVGPLVSATDLDRGEPVLLRLAAPADFGRGAGDDERQRSRLAREASILRGLRHPQVVAVRASTSSLLESLGATVLDHPGRSLDAALAHGLRVDGTSLRTFLASLLGVLADLEEKSPPVHTGALHAGNVAVDDGLRVTLVDFARATDTLVEAPEAATARPGMAPPGPMMAGTALSPCALDLWAVGVLAVQLASRTAPADLPRDVDGRLDLARAVQLDDRLQGFLRKLMTPAHKGGFASKRAAREALRALDVKSSSPAQFVAIAAGAVFGIGVLLTGLGAVAWLMTAAPHPDVPPDVPPHVDVPPFNEPPPVIDTPPRIDPPETLPPPQTKPPERGPPPRIEPPKHDAPPFVDVDAPLLRAIEAAVRGQQAEIEACPDDGSDRIKLHLALRQQKGIVKPLARGDVDAVVCVADAVSAAAWPSTPHQQVDADIWVWRKPAFKVAAY